MKRVLKILGWSWGISFAAFMLATLYQSNGNALPDELEHYRSLFQNSLEWFLSSWLFGAFFVVMWLGISLHMSKASGWKNLSKVYSNRNLNFINPPSYTSASGKFGEILHNGMLKVGFSRSGIVFKVLFPFRLGHPPLYVPWNSIESINIQKSRVSINSPFRKVSEFISPFKYAKINLTDHPKQVILVSWKKAYINNVPPEVVLKNDF